MTYGPRHTIQDEYGQEITVDVELGDGSVWLHWPEDGGPHPASTRIRRIRHVSSNLTPEQARNLASQLNEAAEEVEGYGG